jgi:hypothetical protein
MYNVVTQRQINDVKQMTTILNHVEENKFLDWITVHDRTPKRCYNHEIIVTGPKHLRWIKTNLVQLSSRLLKINCWNPVSKQNSSEQLKFRQTKCELCAAVHQHTRRASRLGVGVRSRPNFWFLFFGPFWVRSLKFKNRIYLTYFDNRKFRAPDISVFTSVMTVLCKRGWYLQNKFSQHAPIIPIKLQCIRLDFRRNGSHTKTQRKSV